MRVLIDHGADVNAVDNEGRAALHLCAENPRSRDPKLAEIAQLLVEAGALIEITDQRNMTPLQVAAEKGNDRSIEVLVGLGADVNARSASARVG